MQCKSAKPAGEILRGIGSTERLHLIFGRWPKGSANIELHLLDCAWISRFRLGVQRLAGRSHKNKQSYHESLLHHYAPFSRNASVYRWEWRACVQRLGPDDDLC